MHDNDRSLRYVCLFAHDYPSTPESDWDVDHGHVDGWAEWFEQMPLLFLYLLGDAGHLPQLAPCALYDSDEAPSCLMAPMAEVQARWLALHRHMQPRLARLQADARAQWEQMHATVAATARQWLILDVGMLVDAAIGTPDMDAFLQQTRQRCAAWNAPESPDAGELPPALRPLLDADSGQWGWWSPNVTQRVYTVEKRPYEEWPAELRARYAPAKDEPWREEVQAYLVRPIEQVPTGSLRRGATEEPDGPMGLVTPYGRWLVHPDEGAHGIYLDANRIVVRQRGKWSAGVPGGIKDLNGRWVIPFSAGYLNLPRVTDTLALGRRTPPPADMDQLVNLLRWPGGETLFENVTGAAIYEDGWVRVFHADDTVSVIDAATGEPIFEARYKDVSAFHKKLRLAVVERLRPGEPSPDKPGVLQGVIHESGRMVIPCEYAWIHHTVRHPPRLLQGRRLLAFTPQGQPHFYSTDGKLLAAPECTIKPWIWTPIVKDNQLLAFDGEGMDARAVWVSLADYRFTETGETRVGMANALQQEIRGWLPS